MPRSFGWIWPVAILLGGALVSTWTYLLLHRELVSREESFFNERISEATAAIEKRVGHYLDALHGGTSFYTAAQSLNRDGWRIYAESLQMRTRYPGINGLGVILAVKPDEVPAWQARVRGPGEPELAIRPFPATTDGDANDPKYLITFLEGGDADRGTLGRNIATEPSRRLAADTARDTGQPQFHRRRAGSRDMQRRSGLLLYAPLYSTREGLDSIAARRAAHLGWVYAQIYPDVFLGGVLGPLKDKLDLHFFEGERADATRLLYASNPAPGTDLPVFQRLTQLTLAGAPFTLGWQKGRLFPATDKSLALWVGGSLGAASLFLAGLVASLQSIGRRARRIADAKTAELAASEEGFRQAFDSAGIGMALVGLDGRWLRVNPALCDILGYSEAKLLDRTFQDVTHPDDVDADVKLLQELIEGGRRSYQMEKRYFHRDGQTVWVRLTVSLARRSDGSPLHAVAQIEDITEQRHLQSNLAALREQAIHESRMANELLHGVLQQVRNPTNDLIGIIARLRNSALSASQAEHVRALDDAADALLALLNDIGDLSKIEAGDVQLELAPFDVGECVNASLALFAERARAKQLRLSAVIATRVPPVVIGDARRLRQILVNLLNNAIKSTPSGEIRVNVTAEALDAANRRQRLKFAVRDNGVGLPQSEVDRLFKSFSPVDAATRRVGGTGLGLALSSRVAELMGGTMWAESEVGRGSTFHFTILVEPRDA